MAMAAPKYLYHIPSLATSIPDLPVLGDLDITRGIQANDLIDYNDLNDAKLVVKKLKATLASPFNPGVTETMVNQAKLRARAIESAHTAAVYAPGMMENIATILQYLNALKADMQLVKNDMQVVKDEVRLNNAMIHNQRIIALNQHNHPAYAPLRKTVPGHDLALLDDVTTPDDRSGLVQPANAHPVGSVPPGFGANGPSFTRKQIASYMLFYNEDFGIVGTDDVHARRNKFIRFLSTY